MPCLCGRLMREAYAGCLCTAYAQCLCGDYPLALYGELLSLNFSLRPQPAYAPPYAALCKAYAQIRPRDGKTTGVRNKDRGRQRQRKRGREREAEAAQSGPPSLMQNAYAHKPEAAFILLPMRNLFFALCCSVLAYACLCASYVVRGIALCRIMRFFLIAYLCMKHSVC